MRIVSLLPAATEIVCELGLQDDLVGISHECDFPKTVSKLPRLSRARLPRNASGAELHGHVEELIRQGLSIYEVDVEGLRALKPDLIITQTQCALCAVSPADLVRAVEDWFGSAPTVVSLEAMTLGGIYRDIVQVASAAGCSGAGDRLALTMKTRIGEVADRAQSASRRPTLGVLEWLSPLMAGGNWMPELIELAGCRPVWGAAGEHSPWLEPERLLGDDPDMLLLIPCGYGIAPALAEAEALRRLKVWPELRAVKSANVFVGDGNAYFNRPGPRIVESLEAIFEMAHESGTGKTLTGRGWVRFG